MSGYYFDGTSWRLPPDGGGAAHSGAGQSFPPGGGYPGPSAYGSGGSYGSAAPSGYGADTSAYLPYEASSGYGTDRPSYGASSPYGASSAYGGASGHGSSSGYSADASPYGAASGYGATGTGHGPSGSAYGDSSYGTGNYGQTPYGAGGTDAATTRSMTPGSGYGSSPYGASDGSYGSGTSAYQGSGYGTSPYSDRYAPVQTGSGYPSPTYYPDTSASGYPATPGNYPGAGAAYGASGLSPSGYPSALSTASSADSYPALALQPWQSDASAAAGITGELAAIPQSSDAAGARGRRTPRRLAGSQGGQPEPHVVYPASGASASVSSQVAYTSTPDSVPPPPPPSATPPATEVKQPSANEYGGGPATATIQAIQSSKSGPVASPAAAPIVSPTPSVPVVTPVVAQLPAVAPMSWTPPQSASKGGRVMSQSPSQSMPSNVRVRNVAFFRVLRSEWLKFRTLGSTWWILVIALLLTVGVGELVAWSIREILNGGIAEVPPEAMVGLNSTEPSVGTLQLSQLVLTILGVLFITNEFSSGSIRSTVIAAPTRSVVIIAKAVILTFVTFIVSFVALFGTEELSWYTFTSEFVEDVRTVPEGLKIIAGASLANTLIVLFAFGIGVLLHNTAGSIGLVLGTLLVVPIVMQMLPWDWAATAAHYLPSACTTWLYTFPAAAQQAADNPFTFLEALGVSCAWAFVPLLLGLITFKVRDANASGA